MHMEKEILREFVWRFSNTQNTISKIDNYDII